MRSCGPSGRAASHDAEPRARRRRLHRRGQAAGRAAGVSRTDAGERRSARSSFGATTSTPTSRIRSGATSRGCCGHVTKLGAAARVASRGTVKEKKIVGETGTQGIRATRVRVTLRAKRDFFPNAKRLGGTIRSCWR